jgi:hypothetical protein
MADPTGTERRRQRLVDLIERARARRLGLAALNAGAVLGAALALGVGFLALTGRFPLGFWFLMFCAGAGAILLTFKMALDPKDPLILAQSRMLRRLGFRIGWRDDLDLLQRLMQRTLRKRAAEGATLSGGPIRTRP